MDYGIQTDKKDGLRLGASRSLSPIGKQQVGVSWIPKSAAIVNSLRVKKPN